VLFLTAACTGPRQSVAGSAKPSSRPTVVNKDPRFLDDISITPGGSKTKPEETAKNKGRSPKNQNYSPGSSIEKASALQFKYAQLLNTGAEEIKNIRLFEVIDDWYGTRYCMGGTTKNCIDCSAFVQALFSQVYGITLPRTAKEQYAFAKKISSVMLKEGDLLFYNTRGGVSHVGIYLQNNKFVHASTTGGVMISDMFEAYYVKHFISAGRINNKENEVTAKRK
jgi:murein DD-endopeptidase / murein LD-carboxypeptidase